MTRDGVREGVRQERIIHALDGIDGVVSPGEFVSAGTRLWSRAQSTLGPVDVDYLLGLDSGGILAAVAVSLASGVPYKLAWKLDLHLPEKLAFTEARAMRPQIYAYGLNRGSRTLLIDDEVSTGDTAVSVVNTLRSAHVDVIGMLALIEDGRFAARDALAAVGVPLVTLYKIQA